MADKIKQSEYLRQLREKSSEDLLNELSFFARSLYSLRLKLNLSQTKDTSQVRKLRSSVAQVKTLLREREIAHRICDY